MSTIAYQITSLTIVYSTVYSGADQRKHQSSASLTFVRGIHRGLLNSPHKWPVTRKIFPFDDAIMLQEQWCQSSSHGSYGAGTWKNSKIILGIWWYTACWPELSYDSQNDFPIMTVFLLNFDNDFSDSWKWYAVFWCYQPRSKYHHQLPMYNFSVEMYFTTHDLSYSAALMQWFMNMMTSALLAICAGNSPVPGEFHAQRPVTRSFDVFFDLRLNKRLSKQSWCWWFQMLSLPLWRHRNDIKSSDLTGRCNAYSAIYVGSKQRHHTWKHWRRDKIAAILQTTFSNTFSWVNIHQFRDFN